MSDLSTAADWSPRLPASPDGLGGETPLHVIALDDARNASRLEDRDAHPFDLVSKKMDSERLQALLPTLPAVEKRVLELRFGLGEEAAHNWPDLAAALGLGEKGVRLLHDQALERLRLRWDEPGKVGNERAGRHQTATMAPSAKRESAVSIQPPAFAWPGRRQTFAAVVVLVRGETQPGQADDLSRRLLAAMPASGLAQNDLELAFITTCQAGSAKDAGLTVLASVADVVPDALVVAVAAAAEKGERAEWARVFSTALRASEAVRQP
jgi:hypothetical protein